MSSHISSRLNAELLEQKYALWNADPSSVGGDWAAFFEGFELGSAVPRRGGPKGQPAVAHDSARLDQPLSEEQLSFRGKVVSLVYNYRTLGHTQAHINPLQNSGPVNPRLELKTFGFTSEDLDREAATQFFRDGQTFKLSDLEISLKK